jgi:hypothetical protein
MHRYAWLNAVKHLTMLCVVTAAMTGCKGEHRNAAGNAANTLAISGTPTLSVNAGQAYEFQPTVTAPPGATISFSIQNKPAWATLDMATGRLYGTPTAGNAGSFGGIAISVSDGTHSAALAPFGIAVMQAAPVVAGSATVIWTAPTTNLDGTALTNLAGFRIYYGNSANTLTRMATVADPRLSSYVLGNLAGGSWYFAVAAYTADNVESELSEVVSKTI